METYGREIIDDDKISMTLIDFIILLSWVGGLAYSAYSAVILQTDFNMFGAIFGITMAAIIIKSFYVIISVTYKELSEELTKRGWKLRIPKIPTMYDKRLEISIRIVGKDNSKVKF
jgi:hypothetical protein